jgi:hypothetical protein
MAKLAFSKLGLKSDNQVIELHINEQIIEVKQYLPINDKLGLISRVINLSADENNFANPVKIEMFGALEILYAYTNLSFTEKQKEDVCKLYDLLESNGIIDKVINAIPKKEYDFLLDGINESIKAVYAYRSSAMGIMEAISQDYSNLDLDATNIQEKMSNPENLTLLKDVLTKLG